MPTIEEMAERFRMLDADRVTSIWLTAYCCLPGDVEEKVKMAARLAGFSFDPFLRRWFKSNE